MPTNFVSFTATPDRIANGGSLTLSWNVTGAQLLTLSSDDGLLVEKQGLVETTGPIIPKATDKLVTYTLTAVSAGVTTKTTTVVSLGNVASPPQGGPVEPAYRQIFSATGLPPGMVMSETGLLSGTPTVPGLYAVVVKVIDSNGLNISTEELEYVVNPSNGALLISPEILPEAVVGTVHSIQFKAEKADGPLSAEAQAVRRARLRGSYPGQYPGDGRFDPRLDPRFSDPRFAGEIVKSPPQP